LPEFEFTKKLFFERVISLEELNELVAKEANALTALLDKKTLKKMKHS